MGAVAYQAHTKCHDRLVAKLGFTLDANRAVPFGRLISTLGAMTLLCLLAGCQTKVNITELLPRYSIEDDAAEIPLIIVGRITEIAKPAGAMNRSKLSDVLCQLWSVKVSIEHVIQGSLPQSGIVIYYIYFMSSGGSVSPLRGMRPGEYFVFFLQNDGDDWRTICDGFSYCVWPVTTGPHPRYVFEPRRPGPEWDFEKRQLGTGPDAYKGTALKESILDFLFSRGPGTTDLQVIDLINHKPDRLPRDMFNKKLVQVAKMETPPVRLAACHELKRFGKPCE